MEYATDIQKLADESAKLRYMTIMGYIFDLSEYLGVSLMCADWCVKLLERCRKRNDYGDIIAELSVFAVRSGKCGLGMPRIPPIFLK